MQMQRTTLPMLISVNFPDLNFSQYGWRSGISGAWDVSVMKQYYSLQCGFVSRRLLYKATTHYSAHNSHVLAPKPSQMNAVHVIIPYK
jgi:hypothetical protein